MCWDWHFQLQEPGRLNATPPHICPRARIPKRREGSRVAKEHIDNVWTHNLFVDFKDREFGRNDHAVALSRNDAQCAFPGHKLRIDEIIRRYCAQLCILKRRPRLTLSLKDTA